MQAQCHSVLIRTYLIFMNIEKVNLDTLRGDVKTPKHDLYISHADVYNKRRLWNLIS